jgi:menaquinone-dependent protoporphyrinogen oxidase
MLNILIVYGTRYGQTERIALRIAEVLRGLGCAVDIHRGDTAPAELPVGSYGGVVVASSILFDHYQKYIRRFVRDHVDQLNQMPSAFVSVCGAAGTDPERASGYVASLLRHTGWHPALTQSFSGALVYTRYSWPLRWVMKQISRRVGRPTDTSRDWDLTEWAEVDRFARRLAVAFGAVQGDLHAAFRAGSPTG